MRPVPLISALLAAGALGVGGLAPTANAATEVDLHAVLSHGDAFPNATGHSEYDRSGTANRDVEVTVRHIVRLAGTRLVVVVNNKRVGTMRVNSSGAAHREWDTERGQYVPYAAAGDPVRVRVLDGPLVATGRYHRDYSD